MDENYDELKKRFEELYNARPSWGSNDYKEMIRIERKLTEIEMAEKGR